MRRLFFVAYSFPPRVTSGTFRVAKFIKYLPEFFDGEIHVVTAPAEAGAVGDAGLEGDVAGRCTVHRVAADWDPKRWRAAVRARGRDRLRPASLRALWRVASLALEPFYGAYTSLREAFVYPDGKVFWSRAAARHVERALAPRSGDVLLTTSPERSVLVAGARLKRRNPSLRWVADFRDGWHGRPFNYPTRNPLKVAVEARMEAAVFAGADAVVCATDGMADVYRRRYPAQADKITTIFNGFDPEDFDGQTAPPLPGEGMHVVYTGRIGGSYRTDTLLEGLRLLRRESPERWEALRFHAAGAFDDDPAAWEEALPQRVHRHGQLGHRQAIGLMLGADVLLLLLDEAHGGETVYSGKLFEYLRAGAPILAVSHRCGATRLIEEHGLGVVAPQGDPEAVRRGLERLVDAWRSGTLRRDAAGPLLARFDRRHTARQLAGVLRGEAARGAGA